MAAAPLGSPRVAYAPRAPRDDADAWLAQLAVDALIDEAQLTPKPALVDRRGNGAHTDLDLPTMLRSARALQPTFAALAQAARHREPSAWLRTELARIGRDGEQSMMRATNGSNAHRGAIWIVGLLVAGAAMCELGQFESGARAQYDHAGADAHDAHHARGMHAMSASPLETEICALAAQIACFPDLRADVAALRDSHGERVRRQFRVGGARQEAQYGFPHVIRIGLPALRAARANGIAENAARVDTLLAIVASLDDTCLLHRAGLAGLQTAQHGAQRVLSSGGSSTPAGAQALHELDGALLALNASPGGAADLLAATLFTDMLVQRSHDNANPGGSAVSWNI